MENVVVEGKQNITNKTVLVAYLNCRDAELCVVEANLTGEEFQRVESALAWLQDTGLLLVPKTLPLGEVQDFGGVLDRLRTSVGDLAFQAAVDSDQRGPLGDRPQPAAVMPVWTLEPEGGDCSDRDVLLGSGRLWGADVLVEALRVDGPDEGQPVRSVRSRYYRWIRAAGGGCQRVAVRPPGEDGWYVVSAISAAS